MPTAKARLTLCYIAAQREVEFNDMRHHQTGTEEGIVKQPRVTDDDIIFARAPTTPRLEYFTITFSLSSESERRPCGSLNTIVTQSSSTIYRIDSPFPFPPPVR